MVLTLYGQPQTACTRRVAVVLHEKQVPFKFVSIDLAKGEHKSPEYLQHQPFGQVPYIDDDGFILYESRAIARYICSKYPDQGTRLIPSDPKSLALLEQAASVELSHFETATAVPIIERIYKPLYFGLQTDEEKLISGLANLAAKLDVYEGILAKQKYVAGDELSLIDLFHIPQGVLLTSAGSDALETKPNLSRWWKEIASRPSWLAVQNDITSVEKY